MNKRRISFKIDDYTINLFRGKEESEEIRQKRMVLFINCLRNMAMKPMTKFVEENFIQKIDNYKDNIK